MGRNFMSVAVMTISIIIALAGVFSGVAFSEEAKGTYKLEPVIITAPEMQSPLEVNFNPKAPQQPLPAQDGAAFLKSIPGMSVIRKGGTDGDPVFRGMAGSRLSILLDGACILGGCGNRMDPPTAYVYPETYDRVTLIKGPQTILYGPSNSAGVVLFERENKRFEKPGWKLNSSPMGGSFGRHDEVLDVSAGIPNFYFRSSASNSHSNDYVDGDSTKVHSEYDRWSLSAATGWTPNNDTRIELSAIRSDGKAAYADRGTDGAKFARENYGLKLEKSNIASWFEKIEAQSYFNYIDHVMDNYTMREFKPAGTGNEPSVMNPDRKTMGGRITTTFNPASIIKLNFGGDLQSNRHTIRRTMSMKKGTGFTPGQWSAPYENMPRVEDALFMQIGVFGDMTSSLSDRNRVISGVRADRWKGEDKRMTLDTMGTPNPTANSVRRNTLISGFARFEQDLSSSLTAYTGVGHNERFPDYWELIGKEGTTDNDRSAFATTNPEKNTQLDIGITGKSSRLSGSLSGFYNKINDFILIQSNVKRGTGMAARTVTITRNVDATTMGGEAGVNFAIIRNLRLDSSIAYVYGKNDTEKQALAQMPPFEGRVGLNWNSGIWSVGSLVRLVSSQDRYVVNEGNIVGQDIGKTPGFAIFSLNGSVRIKGLVLLSVGVDNLFNRTYAEHISRSGAMVAGFEQTIRVNEPGRTFWFKGSIAVD